jgi:excisionase family DNA binding protein
VDRERRLRFREGMEYLNLSERTLRKKIARREIPHYRIGHFIEFDRAELDAWVEAQHVPAKESAAS